MKNTTEVGRTVMERLLKGALLALLVSGMTACEGPEAALKGQENATITFYGLAVDQSGRPLGGVPFDITMDAIPADWTFERRGEPHDRTTRSVITDAQGRFALDVTAHMLFVETAGLPGYRHLFAKWSDETNTGYQVTSWGRQLYKSDPDRPAVYVFVKDGVREVSALPSRGGYHAWGKVWRPNEPAWPKEPSLTDVVQKAPATQPQ